ncbi:cytochrome b/b6 domain-containing protein [Polymorphobacter fuscus]|nr:cytochrome b/b6 domain-containing protein [Polymorphobacter fuscus]NJC07312.1 cytochrome b561 [Polymorphobacter fuscus]
MTSFYLGLALIIALTINARYAVVRALGSLAAATAMGFLAWSVVLANTDGTFARVPAGDNTPLLLNIEAALIGLGAIMLLLSIPRQFRRTDATLPWRNTLTAYGQITRGLHWGSATLVIAAFTIGQFVSILADDAPERAEFLATHMAIGGAIFLLTFARMFERLVRPSPPTSLPAHGGHFLLYALLIATSVTGLALATAPVPLLGLSLPNLPANPLAEPLHRLVLPLILLLLFAAHLVGAIKAIRRMAR